MPDYTLRQKSTGQTIVVRGSRPPSPEEQAALFARVKTQPTPDMSGASLDVAMATQPNPASNVMEAWGRQGPARVATGVRRIASGEVTGGARDVFSGGLVTAAPAAIPLAVAAPAATAAAFLGGAALGIPAQIGVESMGREAGLTDDQAGLAGDVAGLVVGGAGAKYAAKAAASLGQAVTERLPRRLYAQIFKSDADDIGQAWRTAAKGGQAKPTLADRAITEGLHGSTDQMGVRVATQLEKIEPRLQTAAARSVFALSDKAKFVSLLDDVANKSGDRFLAGSADEARAISEALTAMPGPSARGSDVLRLKRFLDRQRAPGSFDSDSPLKGLAGELKQASDQARATLHRNDAISGMLKKYETYIEFADALKRHAQTTENSRLFGLMDGVLSSYGSSGVVAAAVRRGVTTPQALTGAGKMMRGLQSAVRPLPSHAAPALGAMATASRPSPNTR